MRRFIFPLFSLFLTMQALPLSAVPITQDAAKTIQASQAAVNPLRNQDVLAMLRAGLAPEIITAKINSSPCDFDTSPAMLQELKREGAPDSVVLAMINAPKPETTPQTSRPNAPPQKVAIKITKGTVIDVEAPYEINSQAVRAGDVISFRVVNPVKVGGAIVIEPGATATGRIVKASRGGHFGRAGRLAWEMYEVTAVDGTRIPIEGSSRSVGDSKGAKVATKTVLTAAALWPIAPVALLHGFKRGENAVIPAGKRFNVFVAQEATVSAHLTH